VSALSSKGDMRTAGAMKNKLCGLTVVGTALKGASFDLSRVVTIAVFVGSAGSKTALS